MGVTRGKSTKWGNLSLKASFKMFTEKYDREAIFYMERNGIPESWGMRCEDTLYT